MPRARSPACSAATSCSTRAQRVVTFVAIPFLWNFIDIPAWIFLGLWFLSQFLLGGGSGVAWMAHVGGFLAGVGLIRLLAGPRKRAPVEVEYLPPGRW